MFCSAALHERCYVLARYASPISNSALGSFDSLRIVDFQFKDIFDGRFGSAQSLTYLQIC